MQDKTYNIIQFTGQNRRYYGDSVVMSEAVLARGNYMKMSEMDIPLGQSRYGGPLVDLPPGETYPDRLLFAAQLDLSVFSLHDSSGLLPTTGRLFSSPIRMSRPAKSSTQTCRMTSLCASAKNTKKCSSLVF